MLDAKNPRRLGPWQADRTVEGVLIALRAAAEHTSWGEVIVPADSVIWFRVEDIRTPGTVTTLLARKLNVAADTSVADIIDVLLASGNPALDYVIPAGCRFDVVPYFYEAGPTVYVCPAEGSAHWLWEQPGWCPYDGLALIAEVT